MTEVLEGGTLEILPSAEGLADANNPKWLHGVHTTCQRGAAFYITQCGRAADKLERDDKSTLPECEECWRPEALCRLCGEPLV